MRAHAKSYQLDEVPAFDELPEWTPDFVDQRSRRDDRDDDEFGLRALADSPEWLSRSYWRRLRAA